MRINDRQFISTENDKTKDTKKVDSKRASSANVAASKPAGGADSLVLSSRVRDIADIALQLKDAADVREEKVNELREMIKSGAYRIDGKDIAGKIVDKAVNKTF